MAKRKKYDVETTCPDCGGPATMCIGCNECADCTKIKCHIECCGEVNAETAARVAAYKLCEELMRLPTVLSKKNQLPAWVPEVDWVTAWEAAADWDWGIDEKEE